MSKRKLGSKQWVVMDCVIREGPVRLAGEWARCADSLVKRGLLKLTGKGYERETGRKPENKPEPQ